MSEMTEAAVILNRLANIIGTKVFGVDLGVGVSGDRFIFVDGSDGPITDDGEEIIAATMQEAENKKIGDFVDRALRAAGITKYQEIERSRTP